MATDDLVFKALADPTRRSMLETIERLGYRCALGSVYPYDPHLRSARIASAYILANVCPGAVVVLHERGGESKGFSAWGGTTEILINTRPNPSHLLSGNHKSACISSWTRISDNVMPPRIKSKRPR